MNEGKQILLSEAIPGPHQKLPPPIFVENFADPGLDLGWYQLRTPYTTNYCLKSSGSNPSSDSNNSTSGIVLLPNVQSIGISAYISEHTHQDIGVQGCTSTTGLCLYMDFKRSSLKPEDRPETTEMPLNETPIPGGLTLPICAQPLTYDLGYSLGGCKVMWMMEVSSQLLTHNPSGYGMFEGTMLVLFASGNGEPWPYDAPDVGISQDKEVNHKKNIPDYDAC